MGITDVLRKQGWKPEASTDGEWNPYKGVYKVGIAALRKEKAEDSEVEYYQLELDIVEALSGDAKRESKYPAFRRRFYLDGDKATDNVKKLLNTLFTWGITLETSSDATMEAGFADTIGHEGYLRAWGWTPEGKDQATQSWVPLKSGVAEKKRSASSTPF